MIAKEQTMDWIWDNVLCYVKKRYRAIIVSEVSETYLKQNVDFRGKRVLDVGADYGMTPFVFASLGAKSIDAYSLLWQNPFYTLPNIHWRRKKFDGDEYQTALKKDYDILKMDCEGCEYNMSVFSLINHIKEGFVAIHNFPKYSDDFKRWEGVLVDAYKAKKIWASEDGVETMFYYNSSNVDLSRMEMGVER